ncbi:hypothetical protein VNO78_12128 [Psophocarpus tetragonolobus]|uniref:Uncharacterized protein n=1 Tax=Psophocarpus tetragonolobus TaxID=3891 RepID=A0AAN9SQD3_PSOTE
MSECSGSVKASGRSKRQRSRGERRAKARHWCFYLVYKRATLRFGPSLLFLFLSRLVLASPRTASTRFGPRVKERKRNEVK